MNETLNPDASQPQGVSPPEGTPDPQTSSGVALVTLCDVGEADRLIFAAITDSEDDNEIKAVSPGN
ncbi:MAG: hypothetical protein ABI651_05730 [Verrucomicrobiota bacterium]